MNAIFIIIVSSNVSVGVFLKKMIRLINTRKMERIKVKGICSYTNPQRQRLNYCHTMMHITIKTAHEISFNAFLSTLTLEAT